MTCLNKIEVLGQRVSLVRRRDVINAGEISNW